MNIDRKNMLDAIEEVLAIGETGITANRENGFTIIKNIDHVELFRFNSDACPFNAQAIKFLCEIYTIGFIRGKMLGREILKAELHKVLKEV